MISIKGDSISLINTNIPPLPRVLAEAEDMRGSKFPNNDLLVSGGKVKIYNDEHAKNCGEDGDGEWRCDYGKCQYGEFEGYDWKDTYLVYSHSSNQWKEVGKMKESRFNHSSVLLNGCVFTCGGDGYESDTDETYPHEVFCSDGGVNERKKLPVAISGHTATKINEFQYLICGGYDMIVSKTSP